MSRVVTSPRARTPWRPIAPPPGPWPAIRSKAGACSATVSWYSTTAGSSSRPVSWPRPPERPSATRASRAVASDLGGELGAGRDVELGEHVGQVRLHRPARDVEAVADLRVGQPVGDQARDGLLGRGEAEPAGVRAAARAAAAAADAGLAQHRLDASQVAS